MPQIPVAPTVAPEPEPGPRARDAALVLPLLGLFLLVSPVIALFAVPINLAGVPLIVLYLFGVWLALVVGAALLGRALQPRQSAAGEECSPPN